MVANEYEEREKGSKSSKQKWKDEQEKKALYPKKWTYIEWSYCSTYVVEQQNL